ncbi:MAG: histidine kinase [Rubrivivax sp.]|nr:histidine kinase [Rubrivivax sp.]
MDIKLTDLSPPGAARRPATEPGDAAGLLHDLRVHQQELETQNRELRRTQLELAAARDRYRDLYDRAPVGYLTVDPQGRILEANLTAANLLAHAHRGLRGRPLSAFMAPADADRWHLQCRQALAQAEPWRIELTLQRHDGACFDGQLDGLRVTGPDTRHHLRVTLTDVSLRRQADTDRRAALQVMAGQEAERRRLARELHDDLGQHLSVLKMNLAGRATAAVSEAEVEQMVNALDDAVASVRRMATDLRPLMLDDLGLSAAVDALARRSARQFGLQLTLHLTAPDPPPGDPAAVTMYRLLQATLDQLADQPGVRGLSVALRGEVELLVLDVESRCARRAGENTLAPDPGRWTALHEGAHLRGYTLAVHPGTRGGEHVTVRLPVCGAAAAPPAA